MVFVLITLSVNGAQTAVPNMLSLSSLSLGILLLSTLYQAVLFLLRPRGIFVPLTTTISGRARQLFDGPSGAAASACVARHADEFLSNLEVLLRAHEYFPHGPLAAWVVGELIVVLMYSTCSNLDSLLTLSPMSGPAEGSALMFGPRWLRLWALASIIDFVELNGIAAQRECCPCGAAMAPDGGAVGLTELWWWRAPCGHQICDDTKVAMFSCMRMAEVTTWQTRLLRLVGIAYPPLAVWAEEVHLWGGVARGCASHAHTRLKFPVFRL